MMKHLLKAANAAALAAILFCTAAAFAQDKSSLDRSSLDAYGREYLKRSPITGFSVAIVKEGKTVYTRGFGLEKAGGRPMTERSIGAIGSLNKSITAVAVMQLAAEGKFSLDDHLTNYIPWFRTADTSASGRITIRMLLNNSSGLPSVDNWFTETEESEDAIERLLRGISSAKMHSEPGTSWEYSNEGWDLLGLLIRKFSGKSYAATIEENIFAPLGMEHSAVDPQKIRAMDRRYGILTGHTPGVDATVRQDDLVMPAAAMPAGSVTRSTAADLALYLRMLLGDGAIGQKRILPPGKVQELWTPGIRFPAPRESVRNGGSDTWGYAFGWMTAEIDGRTLVFHAGDTGRLSSLAMIDPEAKTGVALMFNSTWATDNYRYENVYTLANNLLHIAAGEKPTAAFETAEKDPNLRAGFTNLSREALKAYEGEYIGSPGQKIRCYLQGGKLLADYDAVTMKRLSEVLFLNPSVVVLRNTSGTMKSVFRLDPSGRPVSISAMGGTFTRLGSTDRPGYARRNFGDADVSALLPESWKATADGSYESAENGRVNVTKGGKAVPAGFKPDGDEVTDAGSGRVWKEMSYSDSTGKRIYRAVAMNGGRIELTVELTAPSAVFTRFVGTVIAPVIGSLEKIR